MSVNTDIWNCNLTSLRSKRFCASSSRTLGREQQKKGMTGEGEGQGREGNACPQTPWFWKTFDWLGAGSVDYLAPETSIKAGMFCWRASQIWSDVICGRRLQMLWSDIYLNHVCVKVYQIWVSSIKSIIGEQWRLVKANLLGMAACVSDWR